MKTLKLFSLGLLILALNACSKSSIEKGNEQITDMEGGDNSPSTNVGVLTASEWNDLNNWEFWTNLINKNENKSMLSKWGIFPNNRFSIVLSDNDLKPLCDVKLELMENGKSVFTAKTDNKGKAELWANVFSSTSIDASKYQISVNNGAQIISNIKTFERGINTIQLDNHIPNSNLADICFVIDATSSMADELKYLKNELNDVIDRIKSGNPNHQINTSALFYKDHGDNYVTKKSEFTNDVTKTINFIKNEETDGGGDYAEAVHTALNEALNNLTWSESAKSRILYLILDAPPHNESAAVSSLQQSILKAAEKGIKLIPILASGADKDTEFSMRLMSMVSNGTFVFITDDSKKGNKHYEPSVGSYKVEYLNNLMVRLVNESLK